MLFFPVRACAGIPTCLGLSMTSNFISLLKVAGWLPLCRVTFRNQNLNEVCSGSSPSPAAARFLILINGLFGITEVEETVELSGMLGLVFAFRTKLRKLEGT